MLAAIVIQGLKFGYQRWSEQGIEILLSSYLELLDSQGRQVMVDGNPGIITGVTPKGELQVCITCAEITKEIRLKPGTISLGYHV